MPRTTTKTPEERIEARKTYNREYLRKYRAAHPEKNIEYRIAAAKLLLERCGYTISKGA